MKREEWLVRTEFLMFKNGRFSRRRSFSIISDVRMKCEIEASSFYRRPYIYTRMAALFFRVYLWFGRRNAADTITCKSS